MTLVGKTIRAVRPMTKEELRAEQWPEDATVYCIECDDEIVFPSRDEEGNGPGLFFTQKQAEDGTTEPGSLP